MSWFLNVLTCLRAPKPTLFIFGGTRIPQKILESIWNHPGKIFSWQIWVSKNSKSESQIWVSNFWVFEILELWNFEILKFWNFEILNFSNFQILKLKSWVPGFRVALPWIRGNFTNLKFGILKFWNRKKIRLKFWANHKFCNLKMFKLKFSGA